MKHLLALRLLALLAICFSGGEAVAAAAAKVPLGPTEARVRGHKAPLAYSILVTAADKLPTAEWKNELVIPAGPNRLAISYRTSMITGGAVGGAIAGASESLNVVQIAFEAEAGHEYYAEMWGKTIFNMGFKITDKTTGKVVAQAKVKDQKKAAKDQAKPAS